MENAWIHNHGQRFHKREEGEMGGPNLCVHFFPLFEGRSLRSLRRCQKTFWWSDKSHLLIAMAK